MKFLISIVTASTLLFAVGLSCVAQAQTTFNVDMTCAPEFDNVFVTGPWCGWCANNAYNTMADPDGDGIYTVTVPDLTGTVEYKYAINGFEDQENLINDMVDGATCAPVTDFSSYANRQVAAGTTSNDYYGTCDGTCNEFPPPPGGTILFRVDMSEYPGVYGTVNLNGSFNGWCGSCAPMNDANGDMIYELAVDLPGDSIQYKFTLDGWTYQESLLEEDPCTSTIDGYTNRTIYVNGDITLPIVCWNECTSCQPIFGCTQETACNFNPDANTEDDSCVFPQDFFCCDGTADSDNDGICDYLEIEGCTIQDAINFDAFATDNDGSCIVYGCTIEIACNYNPSATDDDDSCFFFCPGCTDEEACNYDAEALQNDGSCFYPENENFCDCDGNTLDECGVCGGSGIPAGACDCDGTLTDALGDCGGDCFADIDADGVCDDIDDCVGEFDECGVCNGGGIPTGSCNCDGDVLDDCGICGGDGTSCVGCTYELACNYDSEATISDASQCVFGTCGGCTVIGACNYNPTLTIDDGSCEWCGCLEESSISDAGGVWEGDGTYFLSIEAYPATAVPGATTYRFYVNFDDANDQISAVFGDPEQPLEVNVPEGAFNSPINSNWNASGIIPAFFPMFPDLADDTFGTLGLEGPASTSGIDGAANPDLAEDATLPITTFFLTDGADQLLINYGFGASWYTLNTAQNAYAGDDLRTLVMQITTTGGISGTLNYQVFNQFIPGQEVENVLVTANFDVNFAQGIGGCTDTEAANYCPEATFDDGSCLESYVGCLDEEACNYSATATTDVGAECIYPQGAECDCDGNVLDECGVCGGGGIPEGTCDCEGNVLDECGVCGGSGIPEGQCDCEGNILDECGVCGGEGIPEGDCDCDGSVLDECGECGGQGIAEGSCDCDGNMLDALGVCGGDCLIDQNNNGICDINEPGVGSCGPETCGVGTMWDEETQTCIVAYPADTNFDGCVQLNDLLDLLAAYGLCQTTAWSCGDPLEYQGYDYATVQIGEQCWFAENLRSENYENGDAIPSNLSDNEWQSTTSGSVAVLVESASNLETYGQLYNWYAVDDTRGLCPSGWHVPTDGDWMTVEMGLGMSETEANNTDARGTDQGTQMKSSYGWNGEGNGTNSSGFSGLPGGSRQINGNFATPGYSGNWWSSSPIESTAWARLLDYSFENVYRYNLDVRYGFSVRCIKDSE